MPAMLVPVGERGRVVLPASIREALGIREGDRLVAGALPDGTLRLVPLRKIAQMAKGLLADLRPDESWTANCSRSDARRPSMRNGRIVLYA